MGEHQVGEHKDDRIAWLILDMGTDGVSFQHILSEFAKVFSNTVTFTGQWPGYVSGLDNKFAVQQLGAARRIELAKAPSGYSIGFSYASPQVIWKLLQFKPRVVFANAFSMWTVFALAFKAIGAWKVIIVYEGGSPTYESQNLSVRLLSRRMMVKLADAFVVNSQSGKAYFTDVLNVSQEQIFAKPFLVPNIEALLQCPESTLAAPNPPAKRPVFLFVGQLIPRKGLKILLEACALLKRQGYENYTVRVVGDGGQREELEVFVEEHELNKQIEWIGKVEYRCLGAYFQAADVFIFPTYEDIWGMVLVEAMAFGKPVICSRGAGSVEVVIDQVNGFVCDPNQPPQLASCMKQLIKNPTLIDAMGEESKKIMNSNTPGEAIKTFFKAIDFVC